MSWWLDHPEAQLFHFGLLWLFRLFRHFDLFLDARFLTLHGTWYCPSDAHTQHLVTGLQLDYRLALRDAPLGGCFIQAHCLGGEFIDQDCDPRIG
ncbi:MAG TPA: hypothetical protein VF831_08850, partial [Anaerolineales bacterium]